ncbi:MAG: gliding motility-associated C-terminal domain-containing protein [Ferruginibacter sp.]
MKVGLIFLNRKSVHKLFLILATLLWVVNGRAQAPTNDNCNNATAIAIPANGFGLGNFTSAQTDLTNATVQTGEAFAPAIMVAGLDKKSVWYKFSIASIRAVRVTLTQPGTTITAGDAGFAVYKAGTCIPGTDSISTKLTPIVTFGNTYHPCVPSGDYLVQVTANNKANGPIIVQVDVSDQTGAAYDHPNQAYAFDTVRYYAQKIDFNTECQSIEDATEICNAFYKPYDYNKSAWLTFTTPAYFDYIVLQLSGTGASYYFPSNNNQNIYRSFGFTLYQGDAVTTPINALTTIQACDSIATNGYYAAYKVYKCGDLQTKTKYTIQLFINKEFADDVRLGIMVGGQRPTTVPQPVLSAAKPPNAIGNLPAAPDGTLTQVDDVWGCNSKHSNTACNPSVPDTGIMYSNGGRYDLSSFTTFTLTNTCAINFNAYVTQCGPQPLVRVFKQGLTNNCAGLDTANIIGTFMGSYTIDCLQPGNYTVQVSGQSVTDWYARFTSGVPAYNYEQCLSNNLGTAFRLDMRAYTRKSGNKYSLNATGAFDTINRVGSVMQPLVDGVPYSAVSDTMGCANTVRPIDTTCNPLNNKVIYRQFAVPDSGIADFSNLTMPWNGSWRYRLYSGDANALATAQNVFAYPDKINGLVPKSECFDGYVSCANKTVCVTPGTYTFTTMGGDPDVGRADKPIITFVRTRTKHKTPYQAQDLGSILDTLGPAGGTIATDVDVYDCDDNAQPVNGYVPCTLQGKPATKAIYRQFYLKEPALVRMEVPYYWYCANRAYGYRTLFYGKATDGLAGLTEVGNGWSCVQYAGSTAGCNLLPAGWYSVISYNQGPSYDSTTRSTNFESRYNSAVSYYDEFRIIITPTCKGPSFNRPYKASVNGSGQPHDIKLVTRNGHTAAFPRTDSTYTLPTEYFNCTLDTPFANHRIKSCDPTSNRVAYYIFKTTQQCFLYINAGGYYASLYNKDVRLDSLQFDTLTPMQPCTNVAGTLQYCYFQPGTYTLVVFANDGNICKSVAPQIYADVIGYSRFDYAAKAYDFGVVPPDAVYHFGKVGDVNPINSGRQPSSDFFYCTTGAAASDPGEPSCNTLINPNVYNSGPNKPIYDSLFPSSGNTSKRNLWYTFVVDQPGYVRVHVDNKHDLRGYQPKFAVYKSDVDPTIPFATVVSSGEVDSTAVQGLSFLGTNPIIYYPYTCANTPNEVSFYRDPCSAAVTRYYVLVENVNTSQYYEAGGTLLNTQIEVSIQVDSVTLQQVKHDHYSTAGDIGSVGVGKYTGDTDNFSCATKDPTDPIYYYNNSPQCRKTLWYKFTSTITGNVRYRVYINNTRKQDYYDVQLFRQLLPNDSTTNGLQIIGYSGVYGSDNTYWAQTCVSPGTYYLLLPGCDQVNSNVYPEIELIENVGDFCGRAVAAAINGPGSISASALVDCHTIGTDYGEFGPALTCPEGAKTADYKTSWFRMDIGGTDTLDVTAFIVENTNAASSDIKYRLMTGDCGAMQEQSCVLDALTQNTYQCLAPGQSYYVQVFTPITKFNQGVTGTIDLKLTAVAHADTCAPLANCLANANFVPSFNCTTDDSVKFVNYSTYGTSIQYKWDFGYAGRTSTEVSPYFFYPALPNDVTYTVKLVIENTSCGQKDSITKQLTVPGRPFIDFGKDLAFCDGSSTVLKATSHTGATYTWSNGSTDDTLKVTANGNNDYWVKVDYNNCSSRDTIRILISSIKPKPVQNAVICSSPVSISAYRGVGESYTWSTGETSYAITVSTPGTYWADVKYFDCVYRDSFIVSNANTAEPLGADATVCIPSAGYVLRAATAGAQSYQWQDGSTADTLKIMAPGQYSVAINFGSCALNDTVEISGYPAPLVENRDTSICAGQSLILPSGAVVTTAGVYQDTARYAAGCDSLIRKITVTFSTKPNLGSDTTVCLAQNAFPIDATATGALSYKWQDGSTNPVLNATASGIYWVDVDYGNCIARDSIVLGVYPQALVDKKDTAICEGSSFILPWNETVTAAGSYRDTLKAVTGCDSLIREINLSFISRPQLGNDTSVTTCSSTAFDLNALYNISPYTTMWKLNGNSVLSPWAVTQSGVYQLIAINTGGCMDTALATLTINQKPALGNDINTSKCAPETIDLTALYNTNGLTAEWTLSNVAVSDPTKINTNGSYRLIASGSPGCSDTAFVNFTSFTKPVIGNDTSITTCGNTAFNLDALYNTAAYTIAWKLNGNTITNTSAVTQSGNYELTVLNADGCTDTAIAVLELYQKPILGNDTAISRCTGINIDLTALYNTAGSTADWAINGNAVNNPSAINTGGTYRLIATGNPGCSDTAFVSFTSLPKPVLGNDTTVTVCNGTSTDLNALYSLASTQNPEWSIAGTPVTDPMTVTAAGIYRVILTNSNGCTDTAFATVTVNALPAVGNDTIINICQGNTYNLSALYNIGANNNTWTFNNTALTNVTAVKVAGIYNLTSTTAAGCVRSVAVTLVVNSNPSVITNNPAITCSPQQVDLTLPAVTAGSSPGLAFTYWQNATVTTAYSSPSQATGGTYYIKGADINGCFDIKPVTVIYYPLPLVNAGDDITICDKDSATLSATVSNSSAPVTYQWEPVAAGGIQNPTSATTLVKPSSTQQYVLTVTDGYGCNYAIRDTILVTMQPPVAAFAGNDTIAVIGMPQQLLATGGINYLWSPPSLLNNAGIANPLATLNGDTRFTVQVRDIAGCIGYDTVMIKTFADVKFYIPNAFSPNGDGHNEIFKPVAAGIKKIYWFRIVNRYGEIVFETSQFDTGWDGFYKGKPQPAANYVWWIKGTTNSGRVIEMKGNVVLVR